MIATVSEGRVQKNQCSTCSLNDFHLKTRLAARDRASAKVYVIRGKEEERIRMISASTTSGSCFLEIAPLSFVQHSVGRVTCLSNSIDRHRLIVWEAHPGIR